MNFNEPLLKPIRILLFPFSLIYACIVSIRNFFFDKQLLGSSSFNLPIICVGNLSVGGTGKTPLVEFLVQRLHPEMKIAVLSRGYKRKTRGYALADDYTTALEIGDEPMLFKKKFPELTVAVGEERVVAIPQLLHDKPDTQVILMDDAFQHRSVTAGLNVLLSDYNNLFTRDWFLPTGDLRDERKSYRRAQLLVITKCPPMLKQEEAGEIIEEISLVTGQEIFFSSISYDEPYHILDADKVLIDEDTEVLLITGIANPKQLKNYLLDNAGVYYELLYDDHHIFSIDDLKEIKKKFESITANKKIILTTEKDAVRLIKFDQELKDLPVYVIPMKVQFLFDGDKRFMDIILKFITGFSSRVTNQFNGQKEFQKKEENILDRKNG